MNVYTAADLDDLARLREEVERLKREGRKFDKRNEKLYNACRLLKGTLLDAIKEQARLRAERDEAREECCYSLSSKPCPCRDAGAAEWAPLAREAAGMVQCDTLDRGQGPCGRCPQCLFKAAHPELTE